MEILSKLGFDWQVAFANLINFLIIFFILKKFVFKPLSSTLKTRKDKIEEGLKKSDLAESALKEAQLEKEKIILEARSEANIIVAKAEKSAVSLKERELTKTQTEAQKILTQAQEKIEKEKIVAEKELREKAINLSILGAEKILQEKIDIDKNKIFTDSHLSENLK